MAGVGIACLIGGVFVGRLWTPAPAPARLAAPTVRPMPARPVVRPQVALVIDDCGYHSTTLPLFERIDRPITVAILPYHPYSRAVAELGAAPQFEVMLHLPMEPQPGQVPARELEPHTLTTRMPATEVRERLRAALAGVPHVRGANNHMGSKATTDPALMRLVMQELKTQQLYFIDSVVTSDSVCRTVARQVGIRFAERSVFLDNENRAEAIQRQLRQLVAEARRRGSAIGIGHDRVLTLTVIRRMLPEMEAAGVRFVHVSDVVKQL